MTALETIMSKLPGPSCWSESVSSLWSMYIAYCGFNESFGWRLIVRSNNQPPTEAFVETAIRDVHRPQGTYRFAPAARARQLRHDCLQRRHRRNLRSDACF